MDVQILSDPLRLTSVRRPALEIGGLTTVCAPAQRPAMLPRYRQHQEISVAVRPPPQEIASCASNERFDRDPTRLRYCSMRCEPMSALGQQRTSRTCGRCPPCPPKSGQTRRRSVCPISATSVSTNPTVIYSITSSARASSVGGIVRPSARAVLRLMLNPNLTGPCTARSPGFSPRRMRST